jgi:hypothetical protein
VGHPGTTFVDPIDGPGWEAAIAALLSGEPRRLAPSPGYAELTWSDYFSSLSHFIHTILTDQAART